MAFAATTWLCFASTVLLHVSCASPPESSPHAPRTLQAGDGYESFYTNEVEAWLEKNRAAIEDTVFVSYDAEGNPYRSRTYLCDNFLEELRSMSVRGVGGGNDMRYFYIGQTDEKGVVHGLVNVAAFLAHAMAISIKYDICSEANVDATDFTQKYAISNSCGQWGHTYADEVCEDDEAYMTCDVDTNMALTAADSLNGDKAPPPFECRPKANETDFTGHWDAEVGALSEVYPFANRVGLQHVEGCCWWGRGVLLTRGPCNLGKLNHYLGRQAAAKGYLNFYDVDICLYPEVICQEHDTRGLRWSVGFFEWQDRVQTYQNADEGLDYMKDLDAFVQQGLVDVNRFIDVVGRALPFDCYESNCEAAEERVKQERRDNFLNLVFNVLDLPYLVESTPFPTPPPTHKPTQDGAQPFPQPPSVSPPTDPPTKEPTPRPSPPPTPKPVFDELQTERPTSTSADGQISPPQSAICQGLASEFIPIEECRKYVQCNEGNMVELKSCDAGLLFDDSIGQCNWASAVTCNALTERPTPFPTRQDSWQMQQTFRPMQQPSGFIPQVPQPRPTISPSTRYMPTETEQPTFAFQRPDGDPVEIGEESLRPTFDVPGLISLPSGASMSCSRGNVVFAALIACGASMILA